MESRAYCWEEIIKVLRFFREICINFCCCKLKNVPIWYPGFRRENIFHQQLLMNYGQSNFQRHFLDDIKNVRWYAIIADEATAVSGTEQMSVSIRWVSKDYEVHEDILGIKEHQTPRLPPYIMRWTTLLSGACYQLP